MRILFYILLCISVLESKIVIKDTGTATFSRNDIGMIFYVTVENMDTSKYHVTVKMIKCCEMFEENDMDCQSMKLIGTDMVLLNPNKRKNVTLIYPNMYLYNRIGKCLISVQYADKQSTNEIKTVIPFDTFVGQANTQFSRDRYTTDEVSKCTTVDQDPLRNCKPVDCQRKYLGRRSYFNNNWQRCQSVPACIAYLSKKNLDISYNPMNNQCQDIEYAINIDDLKNLQKNVKRENWPNQVIPETSANLDCHHGTLSNETGFCICHDGWTSLEDDYEPSLAVYHMCNMKIGTWNSIHRHKIKMTVLIIIVVGAVISVSIIFLSLICHLFCKCLYISHKSCKACGTCSNINCNTYYKEPSSSQSYISNFPCASSCTH